MILQKLCDFGTQYNIPTVEILRPFTTNLTQNTNASFHHKIIQAALMNYYKVPYRKPNKLPVILHIILNNTVTA